MRTAGVNIPYNREVIKSNLWITDSQISLDTMDVCALVIIEAVSLILGQLVKNCHQKALFRFFQSLNVIRVIQMVKSGFFLCV